MATPDATSPSDAVGEATVAVADGVGAAVDDQAPGASGVRAATYGGAAAAAGDLAAPKPTAVQRVHEHVRDAVFTGEYAEGSMLSEGQIAGRLGVSRTPVREAFVQLETQGMLRLYPKRGALVVPVSTGDIEAVIETRWAVERHGLERAVSAPGGVDRRVVAGMRAVVERQRELLAAGDLDGFVDQDREFHRVAVAATGNAILIPLYDSLRDRQRRMIRRTVHDDRDRAADVLGQHETILATLEAGKQSKLVKLLADHLRDTRSALLGIEDTAAPGTPPRGPGG